MKNRRGERCFAFGRMLSVMLVMALVFPPAWPACTHPQTGEPAPKAKAYLGLEMLTSDEGVDFNNYLKSVYFGVKREWFAQMPPSVQKGERGIVRVEFRIQQDGTVPTDSIKLAPGSGKDEFDRAARSAIQAATPFGALPNKFSQPYVQLRVTFFYNIDPKSVL